MSLSCLIWFKFQICLFFHNLVNRVSRSKDTGILSNKYFGLEPEILNHGPEPAHNLISEFKRDKDVFNLTNY